MEKKTDHTVFERMRESGNIQSKHGTYALIMKTAIEGSIQIGRLGRMDARRGYYMYIGSAFGPGGLSARVGHHLRVSSCPRWHIDYLRPSIVIESIWFTFDSVHREHQWAELIGSTKGVSMPLCGFGASDCRCPTHLFYIPKKPSILSFQKHLRRTHPDQKKVFRLTRPNRPMSGS